MSVYVLVFCSGDQASEPVLTKFTPNNYFGQHTLERQYYENQTLFWSIAFIIMTKVSFSGSFTISYTTYSIEMCF